MSRVYRKLLFCITFIGYAASVQAIEEMESQLPADMHGPIGRYVFMVTSPLTNESMRAGLAKIHADQKDHDAINADFEKTKQALDSGLPSAIVAAGDNPDLKAAVKDFYVKASTANGLALTGELEGAAEQPYDDARNRLKMEAVAAGKW